MTYETVARWTQMGLVSAAAMWIGLTNSPAVAGAEMWCAQPIVAHEWGVHSFVGDGVPTKQLLPSFFHTAPPKTAIRLPVWSLPADGGDRDIPVLQFHGKGFNAEIPIGLIVGFAHGDATAWYPQVDVHRTAPETKQLEWQHLTLTKTRVEPTKVATTDTSWVKELRKSSTAHWVKAGDTSERFVFYEGKTTEKVALSLARAPSFASGDRRYVLQNTSTDPIHDIIMTHREAGLAWVFNVPVLAPGSSVPIALDATPPVKVAHALTVATLRAAVVTAEMPEVDYRNACTTDRNPAVPFDTARGHRIFAEEADALLGLWGARFFEAPGTTIVYREATKTLDRVMPLAVYTDMFHDITLRRLGLAVWEQVSLP